LYLQEIARIDAATQTLQSTPLLNLWLDADAKQACPSRNAELPVTSHLPYLEHLLAQHSIQGNLRERRDPGEPHNHPNALRDRLVALDTAQHLQHQRRQQVLQTRPEQMLAERFAALQQQRDAIAASLREAEQKGDGSLLMDAKDLAVAERLERARKRIETLRAQGHDIVAAQQTYARYRGLLLWRVLGQVSPRRLRVNKPMRSPGSPPRMCRAAGRGRVMDD